MEPATNSEQTANEQQEVDWKAKYEETLAHSREWEKRAKANKSASEELEKLKEERMSEIEKANAKAEKYQKQLEAYEAEKQRSEWAKAASDATGIPANLIQGSSFDDMRANAQAIADYIADRIKPAVHVPSEAKGEPPAPIVGTGDFIRDSYLQHLGLH